MKPLTLAAPRKSYRIVITPILICGALLALLYTPTTAAGEPADFKFGARLVCVGFLSLLMMALWGNKIGARFIALQAAIAIFSIYLPSLFENSGSGPPLALAWVKAASTVIIIGIPCLWFALFGKLPGAWTRSPNTSMRPGPIR